MALIQRLSELDMLSKFAIVNLVTILSYVLMVCLIIPVALTPAHGFSEEYILSFRTPEHRHMNLLSFLFALVAGSALAIAIRSRDDKEIKAIKGVLSKQDREALEVIEQAGEITQDSLMFRLGWSRPKVSTVITNLEKRNIVQRRREGKTYTIFMPGKARTAIMKGD